jgi:hypothetical protein
MAADMDGRLLVSGFAPSCPENPTPLVSEHPPLGRSGLCQKNFSPWAETNDDSLLSLNVSGLLQYISGVCVTAGMG